MGAAPNDHRSFGWIPTKKAMRLAIRLSPATRSSSTSESDSLDGAGVPFAPGETPKSVSNNPASPARNSRVAPNDDTQPQQEQNAPILPVKLRGVAPPDPELLSRVGCRCLVIDLPGVLLKDIKVTYQRGFVRVEGHRTVGRVKSFRKKFPINHEQIVPVMLSAFLSHGVLLVVAPTKIAASMAAAVFVAMQIANTHRAENALFRYNNKNSMVLMVPHPMLSLHPDSDKALLAVGTPEISAFQPYAPPRIHQEEDIDEDIPMKKKIRYEEQQQVDDTRCEEGKLQKYIEEADEDLHPEDSGRQEDVGADLLGCDLSDILEENEKPVMWSDDSLRDEPSVNHSLLSQPHYTGYLAPIKETDELMDTPGLMYSNGRAYRPLNWVQFDNAWQDDEVHSVISHNSQGTASKIFESSSSEPPRFKVALLRPTNPMLMERPSSGNLEMESQHHPYYFHDRDFYSKTSNTVPSNSPFLPQVPSNSPSSYIVQSRSEDGDNDSAILGTTTSYRPTLVPRHLRRHGPSSDVDSIADNNKEPPTMTSPSSVLYRRRRPFEGSSVFTRGRSTRKTVTWVDEI